MPPCDPGTIVPLISAQQLQQRVAELARQISTDYQGKNLLVVGVLKGAWVFMADLVRALTVPIRCDFVKLSSYGAATHSRGQVELHLDLTFSAAGEHLLVVEDIIDTGISSAWLIEHLAKKQPASLRLCALLSKPDRRRVPIAIDYVGFTIPDHFIFGYGIDCGEYHRELPYIGYVPDQGSGIRGPDSWLLTPDS